MTTDPCESKALESYNASTAGLVHSLFRFLTRRTRLFCRMERLKQMREDMHGKYTELTDEKEVIRTCA
jgi:hypothetical protein